MRKNNRPDLGKASDGCTAVASMELLRDMYPKAVAVYVEGFSDVDFYSRFFIKEKEKCLLQDCDGKKSVIDALKSDNKPNIGICDKDYDFIITTIERYDKLNCIYTDETDMECLIIKTIRLDEIVNNIIKKFVKKDLNESVTDSIKVLLDDIKEFIRKTSSDIGSFRCANAQKRTSINFNNLNDDLKKCIIFDNKTNKFCFDKDSYEEAVKQLYEEKRKHSRKNEDWNSFKGEVNKIEGRHSIKWRLCRGHDLTFIMAVYIKELMEHIINVKLALDYLQKQIEKEIKNEYNHDMFVKTGMYNKIKRWQDKNKKIILI